MNFLFSFCNRWNVLWPEKKQLWKSMREIVNIFYPKMDWIIFSNLTNKILLLPSIIHPSFTGGLGKVNEPLIGYDTAENVSPSPCLIISYKTYTARSSDNRFILIISNFWKDAYDKIRCCGIIPFAWEKAVWIRQMPGGDNKVVEKPGLRQGRAQHQHPTHMGMCEAQSLRERSSII